MSKCYHCGRPGVTRHRTSYYCPHCDTRFYAAIQSVPEGTPYYVIWELLNA